LKIEGRARSAEYVKTVVKAYDEAIHAVFDGSFGPEKLHVWNERLKTVFNRGFWDGYYMGQKLGEWSAQYGSKASKKKEYIGKGVNYFDRIKVADILLEAGTLSVGDEIVILGPTTGVVEHTVTELRVDDKVVEHAPKTARVSFKLDHLIRRSDKVYKLVSR
jgi:putative protease